MKMDVIVFMLCYRNKMIQILSTTEFMPGTRRRRIYMYEDEDVVMTDEVFYESEEEASEREDAELDALLEIFDDT
jgi:hypothetical protein